MTLQKTLQSEGFSGDKLERQFRDFYAMEISAAEALDTWQRLRKVLKEIGYYPLIVDQSMMKFYQDALDEDGSEALEEILKEENYNPSKVVQAGLKINPQVWMKRLIKKNPSLLDLYRGDWPKGRPRKKKLENDSLSIAKVYDKTFSEKVFADKLYLQLAPAKNSWEIPGVLNWNIMEEVIGWFGWGECPPPPVHTSFTRYWNKKYGAEIVSYSDDYYEMIVENPPKNREDALELAKEQYLYCPDIVSQGTETLECFAYSLINEPVWFFWWD